MKQNILVEIAYDGTGYFGWQIQSRSKLPTVQAEVEKALRKLFLKKIRVISSGRTDKGVHAKAQVANFRVETKIPLEKIKKALNAFLPPAIRVLKVKRVKDSFHARFSAKAKIYRYIILNSSRVDVFWRNYAWFLPEILNLEKMQKAGRILCGEKDFSSFAKDISQKENRIRRINDISIKKRGRFVYIDIEANGFLRGMARAIVRALVDVGTGRLSLSALKKALAAKQRGLIGKSAPAGGLYLWQVRYK